MDRGHAGLGRADVESHLPEAFLQAAGHLPQVRAALVALGAVDDLEALDAAFHDGHREGLRIDLGAHVVAQVVDDVLVGSHETADGGHGLRIGADVQVHPVHHPEVLGGAAAVGAHHAETVGVVDHEAEVVLLLQGHDLVQDAQGAGHAEHALGDHEDAAAAFLGHLGGAGEDAVAVLRVVVAELELVADMEADAVQQAGVALGVIDDDVVPAHQGVDRGEDALVAEVEQEGGLLLLEVGEHPLELLVEGRLAGHHPAAHRVGHAPAGGGLAVDLADLGMVRQAQVVVQAPAQDFLPGEAHVGAEFALEFGECEISVGLVAVLADGTAGGTANLFENVCLHDR